MRTITLYTVRELLTRVGDSAIGARINRTQKAHLRKALEIWLGASCRIQEAFRTQDIASIECYLLDFNSVSQAAQWESLVRKAGMCRTFRIGALY